MTFQFPQEALDAHLASLGKTGSGKTSTVKVLVELVAAAGARVCILDPLKSDWWGITSSADGKSPGFPFQILGGPHGHVPLHSSAGKPIGELVARGDLPLSIVDMADFEPGGLQRFFVDFADALLRRMRGVVYLVLEEAHEFAPKELSGIGAESMAIYWAKKLATAGRSKGIRLILVTQRTQSLHNALLGSCETLIAHRLIAPADQEPVKKWLKANVADKALFAQVADDLASLKTGTGWFCCGEAGVFEKVAFPPIATFDNTATPTTGKPRDRKVKTAPVDVDKLRSIIGTAVAAADADDPKKLKARIAELERTAKRSEAKASTTPAMAIADPAIIAAAEEAGERRGAERGWRDALDEMGGIFDGLRQRIDELQAMRSSPKEETQVARPKRSTPTAPGVMPATEVPTAEALPAALHNELNALGWWLAAGHAEVSRERVAVMSGLAPGGSTARGHFAELIKRGLIEATTKPGHVRLTHAGRGRAEIPAHVDVGDLRRSARALLRPGPAQVFDVVCEAFPDAIERRIVAEKLGVEPGGSTARGLIAAVGKLGLIESGEIVGFVRAADWLFA